MHIPSVDSPPRPPDLRTAVRAAMALASVSLLLLVLVAAEWGPVIALDVEISRAAHGRAVEDSGLTQMCRILTDWVWDPLTMRILCTAVVLWLVVRYAAWWTALWLVVTVALSTGVQQTMKAVVGRERPDWPDPVDSAHYAAFPSGHAMTATVVLGLLLWLLHHHGAPRALFRTAVAVAVVSVAGVGVTRVWLGVHWPTDVVGGWLLGAAVVALAVAAHKRRHP
ncbi:phosphatase PAP2 family protein [Streptomyces chromofuscus]|uniref:Phosphatase PAP2 family protein n=1 Tax=Streptomyces chromofuscus TaxID=42881 RepID=A0A7M2TC24_STRCW|nr:phosphatase PAP2 family protein [Streptomyces chromofuscus]QOV45258.1 phosphatase PAP2 family protein [Streptomyces chromofuscus]GGS99068.1 phosphatase PAP2 family protein [Streptomyces chromofuscus]